MRPALLVLLGTVLSGPPVPGAPEITPAVPPPAAAEAHPLHAVATAFGVKMELEVRDLPRESAQGALEAAIAEVAEIERLAGPARSGDGGGIGALNAAAGKGPRTADPRLLPALGRAHDFCLWSGGKNGPLGRDLHGLWGVGAAAPSGAEPAPELVQRATEAAACGKLVIDPKKGTVALAAGSALDLADFAAGLAVDRGVLVLRQRGARNGFIQIGTVRRGFGAGRGGQGWLVELPAMAGLDSPLGRVALRDQALAVAARDDHPLQIGAQSYSSFINQLSGRPAEGVLATIVVSDLAIDAQALAATLTITGSREGEIMMGSIRPRPSILWLLGSGSGLPLLVEYRWSEVLKTAAPLK